MSILEYEAAQRLEIASMNIRTQTGANPFYSLIHAAMRQADSDNIELLKQAFPVIHAEARDRYNAPGGILETDPKQVEDRDNG